jgi:hypothetical protein
MRFTADQLRDKALLALEDAVQECRYRTPRRGFMLRFTLAYLWTLSHGDRGAFETLWEAMGQPKSPWNFSVADKSLEQIYRALGVERPEAPASEMWKRWMQHEGSGGRS